MIPHIHYTKYDSGCEHWGYHFNSHTQPMPTCADAGQWHRHTKRITATVQSPYGNCLYLVVGDRGCLNMTTTVSAEGPNYAGKIVDVARITNTPCAMAHW